MPRPRAPSPWSKEAAYLVVKGEGENPSPKPKLVARKIVTLKVPASILVAENLRLERAAHPQPVRQTRRRRPNLGPNPSGMNPGGRSFALD